jgi:CRP-like cAMP-binding protein
MECSTFKLGEIVLKEGEIPRYFYIVSEGRCRLIKEEIFHRQKSLMTVEAPK